MPEKYTLKFDYELKQFFEEYITKYPKLGFNNVAEYLKVLIDSHKKNIEENLYNLKLNKNLVEIFEDYVKGNPNLGYINGDELIREFIRKKAEEILKSEKKG